MRPQFVQTRAALLSLVDVLRGAGQVALDTEFVGEGTYEPVLCLVQVATSEGIWIVDPLAVSDVAPLFEVLTEPDRELVVLAAREELRFCLRYAGRMPQQLLDVQVAAGLVGFGYPLSHTNLVRKALGVEVTGGEAFTDWRKRPLSPAQVEYSADDVRHLLGLRDRLHERAHRLGRFDWLDLECVRLRERILQGETEERWWKVPGASGLRRRELAALREVWRWRDRAARAANCPPRRVLRDELLIEIARRRPATVADLLALRGLDRGALRNAAPDIVAAVADAIRVPDSELPRSLRREDPPQVSTLGQLLSVVANGLAAEHSVDPALLATTADLQEFVRWKLGLSEDGPPPVLQGWRGEILGQPLLALLEGRSYVRVSDLRSPNPLRVGG
jgi:ribonuclease D